MRSVLFILFFFSSMYLSAQKSNDVQVQQFDKMVKLFDMTPDQATSYKQILSEKDKEISKLSESPINKSDYTKSLNEIQLKYDSKILAILDERQTKIYELQVAMRNSAEGKIIEHN